MVIEKIHHRCQHRAVECAERARNDSKECPHIAPVSTGSYCDEKLKTRERAHRTAVILGSDSMLQSWKYGYHDRDPAPELQCVGQCTMHSNIHKTNAQRHKTCACGRHGRHREWYSQELALCDFVDKNLQTRIPCLLHHP